MTKGRLGLDEILRNILDSVNPEYKNHVYFTPPERGLKYPCIIYTLIARPNRKADNIKYIAFDRYKVTVVDTDPDSIISDKVNELPYSNMSTTYCVDGLNHFVYTIYF